MTLYTVGPKQLEVALERSLLCGLVPHVQGSPGIGKSDIIRNLAKKWNLKVLDTRLSTAAPEDLNGLPFRNGNKAEFLPFSNFPIEGDPLPEGYDGWFMNIDELTSAPKALQAAAYKLILDKEIGLHKLHPRVFIATAGNKSTDRAVVIQQSTALQSRMIHYELTVVHEDSMEFMNKNSWDYRIIGYLNYKKSDLWNFKPDHNERTFACPRTWEFANRLIKDNNNLDELDQVNLAGVLGDGVGTEFFKFCKIKDQVPSIESIISEPEKTAVPREASLRFFVTSSLMDVASEDNLKNIFTYLKRMDEEFRVIFLRGCALRNPKLRAHKDFAANLTEIVRYAGSNNDENY